MKQVYRYDREGRYVEPVILYPDENEQYDIPHDCTDIELPQPNWKPVFKDGRWVETITEEELEELKNEETITTEIEMLMLAVAELDMQREQDKIETQLAIADLAETILGGVE